MNDRIASSHKKLMMKSYLAWFAIALFYLYQYILRVSPGIMIQELRSEFSMTAEQFSTLGAYYLYAYSLVQIPLGLIVDRIGIRKTVTVSILLCVVGAALLGISDSILVAQLSRILVGLGSAAAFMCALKFAVDFLPAGQRGFFMGATLTLGTIGALTAGKPLVYLLEHNGWRSSFYLLAGLGVLLLIIVRFLVPTRSLQNTQSTDESIFTQIFSVVRNRQIMLYACLAVGVYTPLSVLADLWGTAFIIEKYELARADAAQMAMMMYVGLALSSLVLPWLCERYRILDRAIQVCSVLLVFLFGFLLWGPKTPAMELTAILILIGICCGAEMICFTGASMYSKASNSGVTLGVVNTLNMLGGAILQQAIGFCLDKRWTGTLDAGGVRFYSVHDYTFALNLLLGVIILCAFLSFLLRKPSP